MKNHELYLRNCNICQNNCNVFPLKMSCSPTIYPATDRQREVCERRSPLLTMLTLVSQHHHGNTVAHCEAAEHIVKTCWGQTWLFKCALLYRGTFLCNNTTTALHIFKMHYAVYRVSAHFCLSLSSLVAGHLPDRDREGADCSHYPGLFVPHRQYLLAGVVLSQPSSQVAAAGPPLPDLLRHVRLHGHSLYR